MNRIQGKVVRRYRGDTGDYDGYWESLTQAEKELKTSRINIKSAIRQMTKVRGFYVSYILCDNILLCDKDIIDQATKLAYKVQRQEDTLRMERKGFREHSRVVNTVEEVAEKFCEQMKTFPLKLNFDGDEYKDEDFARAVVIAQLSDTHFNELVELEYNRYDFNVASARLRKYAEYIKRVCLMYGASKVVVALTGDLINSDRRLDEMMMMATSRAKAMLISVNLLMYFLRDIGQDRYLSVLCVSGNESRIREEVSWNKLGVSDNYDFIIFNVLKMTCAGSRIRFIDSDDPLEVVIEVNGRNLLFTHGLGFKGDSQGDLQRIIGKWAQRGVVIDYVLYGHVHYANIGDIAARSSSMVGANAYSDKALNLVGVPSQNITVVGGDGCIYNLRVDLSKAGAGYDIHEDIEAYCERSLDRVHQQETILKVVI